MANTASSNLSSLTEAELIERIEAFRARPRCLVVFTWPMAPRDVAIRFTVPEADEEAVRWLGPFAADILEALEGARDGDFVMLIHPATLDEIAGTPPSSSPPFTYLAWAGIPVRELRRSEAWMREWIGDYMRWPSITPMPDSADMLDLRGYYGCGRHG